MISLIFLSVVFNLLEKSAPNSSKNFCHMPHSRALEKNCDNQWEETTSTDAASTLQFQWNFIQARVKNLIKQKKNCQYVSAKMALWMTDCAKGVRSKSQILLEHPAKYGCFFMILIKMEQALSVCLHQLHLKQAFQPPDVEATQVGSDSCNSTQLQSKPSHSQRGWHTDSSPREFCYSKQEEAHVAMAIIHYVKRLKARLQEEQRKGRSLSLGKWRQHIAFFHTSNPTSSYFLS